MIEKKHRRILEENFSEALSGKEVICLHIPDEFVYIEPALIDELKAGLIEYVQLPESN